MARWLVVSLLPFGLTGCFNGVLLTPVRSNVPVEETLGAAQGRMRPLRKNACCPGPRTR